MDALCRAKGLFGFLSTKGSSDSELLDFPLLESVSKESDAFGVGFAVFVSGSGSVSVPVTMSASQSPRPPGAASTAVWGEYTCIHGVSEQTLSGRLDRVR